MGSRGQVLVHPPGPEDVRALEPGGVTQPLQEPEPDVKDDAPVGGGVGEDALDELVGGVMSAGPTRLEAAARTGTPAVIAPGCLDIVNFWEPHTLPEKYRGRRIYQHNPKQTLIRTDPAENAELASALGYKRKP